jgi:hypothetical protein
MSETLPSNGKRRRRNVPTFVAPLLEALQFRGASMDGLKQLDEAAWEALLAFCDRAHLTLLLSDLPAGVAPAWVTARIRVNVLDNTRRTNNILEAYRNVSQALGEAHLEHLVIKGFSQYPGFVKDANLRMQSDIDIFLPAESILFARDIILKMGYEENDPAPNVISDHSPTLVRRTDWQWRGNFFDPEMPPSIELHFCLWNEERTQFAIKGCERFWDRRVPNSVDGFNFVSFDPVDHVAFLSFHILRDLLIGDWIIHHVYELAYFLHARAHDDGFWVSWRRSHSEQMRSLQAIGFSLAETWFHCEVSPEVEQSILALSPAIQQWLRHFSDSPLEWMFTPNHDSVWLHALLVDSFIIKIGIVRRRLLPNRIPPVRAANFASSKRRRLAGKAPHQLSLRYAAHIADRLHHFSHVLFRGIWRGGRWWFSQRQLGKTLLIVFFPSLSRCPGTAVSPGVVFDDGSHVFWSRLVGQELGEESRQADVVAATLKQQDEDTPVTSSLTQAP